MSVARRESPAEGPNRDPIGTSCRLRCWASAQVRHAAQAETLGDFSESLPTGCEEATQQTALAQFLQPCLPGLGRRPDSLETSSRIATLWKRPSKNAPRTFSSRFASRESGSFRHFMNQLRLCSRARSRDPIGALEAILDPSVGYGQRLSRLVAGWEEPAPAPHNFFV